MLLKKELRRNLCFSLVAMLRDAGFKLISQNGFIHYYRTGFPLAFNVDNDGTSVVVVFKKPADGKTRRVRVHPNQVVDAIDTGWLLIRPGDALSVLRG